MNNRQKLIQSITIFFVTLNFAKQIFVAEQVRVHFTAIKIVIDLDLQKRFDSIGHQQVTTVGPLKLCQRKNCFDERIRNRNGKNCADQL